MILSQGHLHWHQNGELSHVDCHTHFERNQFIRIQTQATLKHNLYIIETEFSPLNTNRKVRMMLNRPAGHCSMPNSSKSMEKFVSKRAQKMILLSHKIVTLKEGQGHSSWYQTKQLIVCIIMTSLKVISLWLFECSPTLRVFVCLFVCFSFFLNVIT